MSERIHLTISCWIKSRRAAVVFLLSLPISCYERANTATTYIVNIPRHREKSMETYFSEIRSLVESISPEGMNG